MTTVYDDKKHKDADYITKSAMRSEVSLSEKEARVMWSVVFDMVGLGKDLWTQPKEASKPLSRASGSSDTQKNI